MGHNELQSPRVEEMGSDCSRSSLKHQTTRRWLKAATREPWINNFRIHSTPYNTILRRPAIAFCVRAVVSGRYCQTPELHGHKWATKHDSSAASTDIPLRDGMCSTRKLHPQHFLPPLNITHGYRADI